MAALSSSAGASDGAVLELVGPALRGKTKWLGAAMVDGTLLGIPGHATGVLRVDPRLDRVSCIGEGACNKRGINTFKWLRGVTVGPSAYGIPMWSDSVLKVTPRVDVSKVELVAPKGRLGKTEFKWHGGQLAPNGCIYGVPCYESRVLKIDPKTDAVSVFGDLPEGPAKWYGGILGPDGNMYCVPFDASRVLKVITAEDRVELIGPELPGRAKWHGGVLGPDGCVYGFPAHADGVLRICCESGDVAVLDIPYREPFNGGKYKWGGGAVANGAVYAVPSDASKVLKIDCERLRVTCFGDLPRQRNKWQGGVVGGDGAIWCVPCDANATCRIDPATDTCELVGGLADGPDKYQGGYADHDGNVWCVPECGRRVLKIRAAVNVDGFLRAYLERLGLPPTKPPPTLATLATLVEAHLERVPFENLDVLAAGRTSLEPLDLRDKILRRRRGGHCLELNGLFSEFLARVGFACKLLPCRMFAGPERGRETSGFRAIPSHAAIAVVVGGTRYFVDVGVGEPPLGPVPFSEAETLTPDGMRSRVVSVVEGDGAAGFARDWSELQWFRDGAWAPRLRWDAKHGKDWDAHAPSLAEFEAENARYARQPMGRKFVACKVTRTTKTTVTDRKLKITSPRFDGAVVTVAALETAADVRAALEAHFGIALAESEGLDVDAGAGEAWWDHL